MPTGTKKQVPETGQRVIIFTLHRAKLLLGWVTIDGQGYQSIIPLGLRFSVSLQTD